MFDELWEDTSNRIRGQGINELSVNKYLQEVQGYSFRCCVELDHALSLHRASTAALSSSSDGDRDEKLEDAEDKLVDDIAGVLWRLAYLRRDDIEIGHVLEFARYIRVEQQSLMTISKAAIFEARIRWGPLPWKADSIKGGMYCVDSMHGRVDASPLHGMSSICSRRTMEGSDCSGREDILLVRKLEIMSRVHAVITSFVCCSGTP